MKIFDSELKIMEVLWEHDNLAAGKIAKILQDDIGWNRNTTYTIIKKLVAKGAIERRDPNFICQPLITREEVQLSETNEFINRMFKGSVGLFFSTFINEKNLNKEDIDELKQLVERFEEHS